MTGVACAVLLYYSPTMRPAAALAAFLVVAMLCTPALSHVKQSPSAGSYVTNPTCDGEQLCLVHPEGCLSSSSCNLALSVRKDKDANDGSYLFEMSASYTGYVAVALAESTGMGNDSVVECTVGNNGTTVNAYMSHNRPLSMAPPRNVRLPANEQGGIRLVSKRFDNGVVSCVVSRALNTVVEDKKYELDSGSWVLQLVAGNRVRDNGLNHHDVWTRTNTKVSLSTYGVLKDVSSSDDQSASGAPRPHAAAPWAAPVAILVVLLARAAPNPSL